MYANLIYFVLVLLIYITYIPPEKTFFGPIETGFIFILLKLIFAQTTRLTFRKLNKSIEYPLISARPHRFDRYFHHQAILALIFFSADIYLLNLKSFLIRIPPFNTIPTLSALFFIGLFLAYLSIIWASAHESYRRLSGSRLSKKSYILSNISFNIPFILPWLIISSIVDLINILPINILKHCIQTQEGQVLFFSVFLLVLSIVVPALIKPFWGLHPLPSGPKRRRIEEICKRTKLGYKEIMLWPILEGRMLTAGVMGLFKRFRYILVTEALLQLLDDEEIDAVMAHEIGHIKRRHLLFYVIFFLGYVVLSYALFDLIVYSLLYNDFIYDLLVPGYPSSQTMSSILFTIPLAIILLIYFRFIFGYFMRNCEREADLYAYLLLRTARPLISSLKKIALCSGQSMDRPNWHHFSIRERIDYLANCENDKRYILKHQRKLKTSMLAYMCGIVLFGYVGYELNFGEIGKTLSIHFLEKIVLREVVKSPENPKLYQLLGSIYYESNRFGKAIAAYERSLEFFPENPDVLNNLAWIYATCKKERYRNPKKALKYAQLSANLKQAAYILDTLAESYFVNGMYYEAVRAASKALSVAPRDKKRYYEKQLNRFNAMAKR
nr:tetratricopeptide repeat protein [Desulfobacterales bacterium]